MHRITASHEGQEAMPAGPITISFAGSQDSDSQRNFASPIMVLSVDLGPEY